jgi:predicted secreted protein
MRSVVAALIVLLLCMSAMAAPERTDQEKPRPVITRDAIWNADKQTVQLAKQRCAEVGGQQLEECFADSMAQLGAPPEAVAFTRYFGLGTFVRKFRETGRVDVAYIIYPFRANENNGCFLVNGDPPIVDVDDIPLLPRESMELDKTYAAIKKKYPRVTMWPGDRFHKQYPTLEVTPGGGQNFLVPYALRNFCHACEILGTAFFSFDFDKEGKFIGARFLRIELPVKKPTKTEARRETEQSRFVVMTEEGREFTVRLSSNRTTGYHWRLAGPLEERIVKLVKSEYLSYDTGLTGSGGEEIWTFLGTGRGETEITMEYARPWEKGVQPVKTATIIVSVRPTTPK